MTKYIQKLPAVFQTVTEKKFFDATFDQVFSKKDSEYLTGYIGRRNPGQYNPITDFYKPEPSKNRTWWQLEATAFSKNEDGTKTNVTFYDDLLDRINYYNGNTLNQDRLFESDYYSFSPPIDYDMLLNYQNYYWVDQGPPVIQITGITSDDLIGKSSYTTPDTANPPNLTLSSGMIISLLDDSVYTDTYYVENYGECIGIQLISTKQSISFSTSFDFLPWDGYFELSNGRFIDNRFWDKKTWEVEPTPSTADYITIQRGSKNRNLWSLSNKWVHIDVLNKSCNITETPFPSNAIRALRPIIQFNADLELYNYGTVFNSDIRYGFTVNQVNSPILLGDLYGLTSNQINEIYGIEINNGDLVCFFKDYTEILIDRFPWDIYPFDTFNWDGGENSKLVNEYIWQVNISNDDIVTFAFYPSENEPVENGDIVFVKESGPFDLEAYANEAWYFMNGDWIKSQNKTNLNQAPLFLLYDHDGVSLDNEITYPNNNFNGNRIFSYKINTEPGAYIDPILNIPVVYNAMGISYDIVFENNLITDRYTFSVEPNSLRKPINGYYYYKNLEDIVLYNSWDLHDPCNCQEDLIDNKICIKPSKQRVIDKYVVGYGSEFLFKISVTPYDYPIDPDVIVSVNGKEINKKISGSPDINPFGYYFEEINNSIYVNLEKYLEALLSTNPKVAPVVEIQTYTHGYLDPGASGYFQIPQQLEANPTQLEVFELSLAELTPHFSSIIQNQIGFVGQPTGLNNYRDTPKNKTLGNYILQNVCPTLKSMLVVSSPDLDIINSIRFSQDEYTKFKNKYLTTAKQLIDTGFTPKQIKENTIIINEWVNEILKTINISKQFSNAFAYSYMVASGNPNFYESKTITEANELIQLDNYIDLSNPKNALYIYNSSDNENILLIGQDYYIEDNIDTLIIKINTNRIAIGSELNFYIYKDFLPTYIPSTPTKIGAYGTSVPRLELDTSYAIPTFVIIGHDGSKTITFGKYTMYGDDILPDVSAKDGYWKANQSYVSGSVVSYNGNDYIAITNVLASQNFITAFWNKIEASTYLDDYRDNLLLELEKRIYNLLIEKFRNEYSPILRVESIKSGFFRQTRYTLNEFLDITQSYLNKWTTKNKANYRLNNWETAKQEVPNSEYWKLYNYREAVNSSGEKLNLPGNWKGIFSYFYDTFYPNTRPWEMLGFYEKPSWWDDEYGPGVLNTLGEISWPNTVAYSAMWLDIENGIIRKGPSAIIDPYTGNPISQALWERPGLSNFMPVDSNGDIIPVPEIFDINIAEDYAPFDGFDKEWEYGDGAPVEQAWLSTSSYRFSIQEFLFLMRPGPYGELIWDTVGVELSPGRITNSSTYDSINKINWQYVQNDLYKNESDEFYYWMRPKNKNQIVHAEEINGEVQIRYGYQRWISDRILFLNQNITTVFGQKIRTLDVNLGNKFAGFTNKDTINAYIESISPSTTTPSLILPSNNFNVLLHKGQPVNRYAYSGVIIRALSTGEFAVYGYDLLNSYFKVLDRSDDQNIEITVGGTPAEFKYFENNVTYKEGDIVRYNGLYYMSLVTQVAQGFNPDSWQKLATLPITGGISVDYKPISTQNITVVPYGTVLKSVQEVFDLLIGWGEFLKTEGWVFDEVNPDTNLINDWLTYAKQFLFWLNTNWAPDASIQLSPLANKATLIVKRGYPDNVETTSNGVYSILDKAGISIPSNQTIIDRSGQAISVEPVSLSSGGIYFLQVLASETEHILLFDNVTSFNDVLYAPLLRERQQRIRFNGFRSNGWYGKLEAPGYLVVDDQLIPNFDTIVNNMKYFYDSNVVIDNPSVEALGRHLIGYESKSYFDNLELSNESQYLFYQGFIREKGTEKPIKKLFRSTQTQTSDNVEIFEEWALKLGDFGNTIGQVSTEFILKPEQNSGEVVVARLNYVPSDIGFVKHINILNAETIYTKIPKIKIDPADAAPLNTWTMFSESTSYFKGDVVRKNTAFGDAEYFSSKVDQPPGAFNNENWELILNTRNAKAYAVLDSNNKITRVDVTDPGYGYLKAPYVSIDTETEFSTKDKLYSIWQGEIISDSTLDNVVNIDIDEPNVWVNRPPDVTYSLKLPETDIITYDIPNSGYVNFSDVDFYSFNASQLIEKWGSDGFSPTVGDTIWIAKNFIEDWNVYKLIYAENEEYFEFWKIIEDESGQLLLLTSPTVSIGTEFSTNATFSTDFGNLIGLQEFVGGKINNTNTYTVAFTPYITDSYITPGIYVDPETLEEFNAYVLTSVEGVPLTAEDIPQYGNINIFMLYKSMRFLTEININLLADYININDFIWVDDVDGKWKVYKIWSDDYWDADLWDGPLYFNKFEILPGTISYEVFDVQQLVDEWQSFNPGIDDTIKIEKDLNNNWAVYKLYNPENEIAYNYWKIINDNGNLLLLTNVNVTLGNSTSPLCTFNTDFENIIGLQQFVYGQPQLFTNFIVSFKPYNGLSNYNTPGIFNLNGINYNAYSLISLTGSPFSLTATPLTEEEIPNYEEINVLMVFKTMRFNTLMNINLLPNYIDVSDVIWIDNYEGSAQTFKINSTNFWDGPEYFSNYRVQEKLINTHFFENASIFSSINNLENEVILLPILDPFKAILPGAAKQNITYILSKDPARYNVTADDRLFSENVIFGENQVGQLWWDTSNMRYTYYEQPIALDGSENEIDNLVYRRDNWAKLFPGSVIEIYEWVKSPVPPTEYVGTGVPRNTTSYVQLATSNRFTNVTEINYYFWVLNPTILPNAKNRTLPALDVANILQSPKNKQLSYFCPIQQTINNNSYIFYNVQEILIYKGNNIQIQYRLQERDDQEHTQWAFFREGDPACLVSDKFWNKMVDSLCGYTRLLPVSEEYNNGIIIADNLAWDIGGWDLAGWDSLEEDPITGDREQSVYGEILPVPDPTLSEFEKLGITYRPRQGMFRNLEAARKIFVQSANSLLKYINIRELNPNWDENVQKDRFWEYTNWCKPGYENVEPTLIYSNKIEAQVAIQQGQVLPDTIIQVMDYTVDGRYALYKVRQENPNMQIYTSDVVVVENGAIKLLDTIYTTLNSYSLVTELRELLDAFRTKVMINQYLVDQNELFFSLMNYVLSEQKTPNWVFKTSYIYIKENDIPLNQTSVYRPNQADNIISFIMDAKPYHTQIRNYTSVYTTLDIAAGTSIDTFSPKITVQFSPDHADYRGGRWDVRCDDPVGTPVENLTPLAWDSYGWDVCPPESIILNAQTFTEESGIFGINPLLTEDIDQFISRNDVYTVPLEIFDPSKIGLSTLYPYTLDLSQINLNNPQTFIAPNNIIGVKIGTEVLLPGQDYYVEYDSTAETYTVYFYENHEGSPIPEALVWFYGGTLQNFTYNTERTEIAYTFPSDPFVVNVNTKKPISLNGSNLSGQSVLLENGDINPSWYQSLNITITDDTISYKENLRPSGFWQFYRNSDFYSGVLISELPAPTQFYDNLDLLVVYIDPATHEDTNILPDANTNSPGIIWINGERIEYRNIIAVGENTWHLSLILRGSGKTSPTYHSIGSKVFIEKNQEIPGSFTLPKYEVWNATLPALPNESTRIGGWDNRPWDSAPWDSDRIEFSNINNSIAGGLWYSTTAEAVFMKNSPGSS